MLASIREKIHHDKYDRTYGNPFIVYPDIIPHDCTKYIEGPISVNPDKFEGT